MKKFFAVLFLMSLNLMAISRDDIMKFDTTELNAYLFQKLRFWDETYQFIFTSNHVNGAVFCALSNNKLKELNIITIGHRIRLISIINKCK
jgi:hypothetical protein